MSASETCNTSSLVPAVVSYVFAIVYGIILLAVAIISARSVEKHESLNKTCEAWLKLVWKKRKCYLPLTAHLFDIITVR